MLCSACGTVFAPILLGEAISIASPASSFQVAGNHYTKLSVQPFDLIAAMVSSGDAFTDYARGCVIKYAARIKGDRKKLAEDLRKAADYATRAAERLELLESQERNT